MENEPKQAQEQTKGKLYRFNRIKRKNVAKLGGFLSVLILLVVFGLISLFLIIFPRSTESQIEKRKLATFPKFSFSSYFSGDFTKQVAEYYDDTVPFRDSFKTAGYNFKSIFGLHTADEVKIVGAKEIKKPKPVETSKSAEESKPSETSKETSKQESAVSQVSEESKTETSQMREADYTVENGIIVVHQNGHYRALELLGGGTGNAYVEALNNFHRDLGDSVQIYSMIAPLASEYYLPSNYSGFSINQKECFDSIASRLDDGIISVDIDTVLAQHTAEDIYFRTDHHWTPLGAYYAAQKFAEVAKLDFKELSTYQKNDIEGFVGTMYAFTEDPHINNDPETFTYYVPSNIDDCITEHYDTDFTNMSEWDFFVGVGDPQHNAYLTFMGGDEQVVRVKTNVKNGRKLAIVKDSYGNAIPGYLFSSYEEICVIDMRYFDLNLVDFVKEQGITDLLFTMVAYSALGDNADKLDILRTQ